MKFLIEKATGKIIKAYKKDVTFKKAKGEWIDVYDGDEKIEENHGSVVVNVEDSMLDVDGVDFLSGEYKVVNGIVVEGEETEEEAKGRATARKKDTIASVIRNIVFDYTNQYTLPSVKKAVLEAISSGGNSPKDIEEYARKLLS